MMTTDILISVLENQKKLCCQNTEMHLELICEQLIIALMINILTVLGNNAEIYIEDGRFGKMYVTSDIGRAVLLAVRVPDDNTTANKTI